MLYSCNKSDAFTLKGSFSHLREADFYIYSTDGGIDRIDTIHVVDGQFEWQTPLEREATFHVIFPNHSEQVVFAQPGETVKMKGDAQQLRSTRITGSEDNEHLTRFRLDHIDDNPNDLSEAMKDFIDNDPDNRISSHFRMQLTLKKAALSRLRIGQKLQADALPPDGITDDKDTLSIDTTRSVLMLFWATWKRDSHDNFFLLRRILRQTEKLPRKQQLQIISVSLDTDKHQYRNTCRFDSVVWPSRCYQLSWGTPIIQQFGLKDIPFYILTDNEQIITAIGTDWKRDIEPKLKKQIPEIQL